MLRAKAFTLIELLIVIFLISTVAALVIPTAYRTVDKFKLAVFRNKQERLKLDAYYLSFVKDRVCSLNGTLIICGNETYRDLRDACTP